MVSVFECVQYSQAIGAVSKRFKDSENTLLSKKELLDYFTFFTQTLKMSGTRIFHSNIPLQSIALLQYLIQIQ